jgi:hypothetical protein
MDGKADNESSAQWIGFSATLMRAKGILMIKDYLIMSYLMAIAAWPVTLALIGLSAGAAFYMRRRGWV